MKGKLTRGPRAVAAFFAAAAALAVSGSALALEWNFRPAGSKLSEDIHSLHEGIMLWVVIPIFVGVFGFMFYACFAHRKSAGHKAAQFHENTTVELLWTVIPALILIAIAWPVTKTVIAQKDTSAPDLTIKASLPIQAHPQRSG